MNNSDSYISSSGTLPSSVNFSGRHFTDFEEIPSPGHNLLIKAKRFGRWFLLKGVKLEFRENDFYNALLVKEFELGIGMQHPHIVHYFDFDEIAPYGKCIVMEYIDGQPLNEFLKTNPSESCRCRLFNELLQALAYIHTMQVVHRDLKPQNLLVTRNGSHLRIIDFGLSDSDSSAILKQPAGTRHYAAPEQSDPAVQIDGRADIYAVGQLLKDIFPKPSLRIRRLIRKCTQADRNNRPENVEEVQRLFNKSDKTVFVFLFAVAASLAAAYFLFFRPSVEVEPPSTITSMVHDKISVVHDTIVQRDVSVLPPETIRVIEPQEKQPVEIYLTLADTVLTDRERELLTYYGKRAAEAAELFLDSLQHNLYTWEEEANNGFYYCLACINREKVSLRRELGDTDRAFKMSEEIHPKRIQAQAALVRGRAKLPYISAEQLKYPRGSQQYEDLKKISDSILAKHHRILDFGKQYANY